MECNINIVRKELANELVGSNVDCPYYPCHHEGQDCTFCYCPFYPCNDPEVGGKTVTSKRGEPVWSCKECHFLHTKMVSEYVHSRLRADDFPEGYDLDSLFREIKDRFLNLYN